MSFFRNNVLVLLHPISRFLDFFHDRFFTGFIQRAFFLPVSKFLKYRVLVY